MSQEQIKNLFEKVTTEIFIGKMSLPEASTTQHIKNNLIIATQAASMLIQEFVQAEEDLKKEEG